jgi:hypothetical protein
MRIVSDKYTAIGGRIGSMVALMNAAGMCFRNWVVPRNPRTAAQTGVRDTLTTLGLAWRTVLTEAQREAWRVWASTLELTSKLGTPYTISGFDAFVAGNGARRVAAFSQITPGPVVAGWDSFTTVVPTWDDSSETISIAYTNSDGWAGEVGGGLVVRRATLGFSAGIVFYEGPFIYAGKVLGAVVPPTSPLVITLPAGSITIGTQYAIAVRSVRADGRCSQERIFRGVAVA